MNENDDDPTDYLRHLFWFDDQKAKYKEQLASALVAFNQIENAVSDMIATILSRSENSRLIDKTVKKLFMARVEALELLLASVPGTPPLPFERLKSLASTRNEFAHGHFSSDPNTGGLLVLGKGKATPWREDAIIPFLEDCASMRLELASIYAFIMFGDGPTPLPPGASGTPR